MNLEGGVDRADREPIIKNPSLDGTPNAQNRPLKHTVLSPELELGRDSNNYDYFDTCSSFRHAGNSEVIFPANPKPYTLNPSSYTHTA